MQFIVMAIGWAFLRTAIDNKYSDLAQIVFLLIGGMLLVIGGDM